MVVLEFCRHVDADAQADRAEEYARALGADEPFVLVARDALTANQDRVTADWSRFTDALHVEQQALDTATLVPTTSRSTTCAASAGSRRARGPISCSRRRS